MEIVSIPFQDPYFISSSLSVCVGLNLETLLYVYTTSDCLIIFVSLYKFSLVMVLLVYFFLISLKFVGQNVIPDGCITILNAFLVRDS